MSVIAECLDDPAPADGSPYAVCTNVVWVNEVSFSLPDWTFEDYGTVASAVWLLLVSFWVIRAVRKHT